MPLQQLESDLIELIKDHPKLRCLLNEVIRMQTYSLSPENQRAYCNEVRKEIKTILCQKETTTHQG